MSVCFVDLTKAFDSVKKQDILEALREKGIDQGLILAVESLYKKTRNVVRFANCTSQEIETTIGIRQSCSLGPLLFILVMDSAIRRAKEKMRKFHLGHANLRPVSLALLAFADDAVIFSDNDKNLQYNFNMLIQELLKINMIINPAKTKVMRAGKKPRRVMRVIRVEDRVLEQVENFKYLGAKMVTLIQR